MSTVRTEEITARDGSDPTFTKAAMYHTQFAFSTTGGSLSRAVYSSLNLSSAVDVATGEDELNITNAASSADDLAWIDSCGFYRTVGHGWIRYVGYDVSAGVAARNTASFWHSAGFNASYAVKDGEDHNYFCFGALA